jgi:3-oxoacyl-(acyl-carrier-protein) synthase/NAD(P)-dependent dehydrogenase (short-subunit alcohol dehydrogenase family)/acyl-CoA thioesterase FadM
MSAFFATEYTIHFDDTMAYGSHHFMTGFKFQCAVRETFMFGEYMYDVEGVAEELDAVHLFTADAYSRNLKSKKLGERVVVFLSLEEWGLASARFCYRVIDEVGAPVCAGFQTLVCADAGSGIPMQLPPKVREAMDRVRQIEELESDISFRDRVLTGGSQLDPLFSDSIRQLAVEYLQARYPAPKIVSAASEAKRRVSDSAVPTSTVDTISDGEADEVWVFAGQGLFDAELLSSRVNLWKQTGVSAALELQRSKDVVREVIGGDAGALFSGSAEQAISAIAETPEIMQPAIHLQNTLGGVLRLQAGHQPTMLTGHSFGEIAAFGLAGCFDLETGVRIACLRAMAITRSAPPGGGLMVATAPRAILETEIAIQGFEEIVVAGRNHDKQTVLSGPKDQLQSFREGLAALGISAMPISSPTSFHHPRLGAAASDWLAGMQKLPIGPPQLPLFTCMGRRLIGDNENVAEVLASQLVRPFDMQGAIADMVSIGMTTFVDCGSSGSLMRLLEKSEIEGVEVILQSESSAPVASPVSTSTTAVVSSPSLERSVEQQVELPSIAIVGSGCILPGRATSPEQLFESIAQQRMGIVDVRGLDPFWSQDFYSEKLVPDKSTSHLSGRVNNDDIQVPAGVEPAVFERFTRFQKLLCISIAPLAGTLEGAEKVTCLVGSTADGYEDQDEATSLLYLGIDPANEDVNRRLGTAKSSGRMPHEAVQEVFDIVLRPGLKITLIDAACASSLYSVALGMSALETGKADAVIAGGCFCPGPGNSCLFSQFNGTTSTGCRPFDEGADGVVFSEAAAFVTLRRLDDAREMGLPLDAVVRATGLSSDGRSPSANVPQTKGQILSLQRCYANYSLDPKSIEAIEGHGTSTSVGDSTELETLRQFFSDFGGESIPVHSLKGTLGHAGWAAGTASIIAATEYLRRKTFPAQAGHKVPSDKLQQCAGTLRIADRPLPLPQGPLRVAIDGFGFGGANAHVVLENLEAAEAFPATERVLSKDDELVFVACHQIEPTLTVTGGRRFDRQNLELPEGYLVLPEIVEDMDVTQTLMVNLADGIVSSLSGFSDDIRSRTSVILAFQGKTERGVEATARVMSSRFDRQLGDESGFRAALEKGLDRSRPSGPYTLQCMMPNVATGRAALLLDLQGPNFVVDSGAESLASAVDSASLLLQSGDESGTKLVIVAAIDAASNSLPDQQSEASRSDEFALAWGISTRSTAQAEGWEILAPLKDFKSVVQAADSESDPKEVMRKQSWQLLKSIDSDLADSPSETELESANDDCPIHTPSWVRRDLPANVAADNDSALVVVTGSDREYIRQLQESLPNACSRFLIIVVGTRSGQLVNELGSSDMVSLDVDDEPLLQRALAKIKQFHPNAVVVTEAVDSWDLSGSLNDVACNEVCEAGFLLAQGSVERLRRGSLEMWGLFPGSFNGTLHAKSGSVAGLIKSILREIPALQCGVLCTDKTDLSFALECLSAERGIAAVEPEVAWLDGQRFVRRLRKVSASFNPQPQVVLNHDSVIVATGGARGVTAVMLESIAQQSGCNIIAFGRSPLESGVPGLSSDERETAFYEEFIEENPNVSASEMKRAFEKAQARWEADETIRQLNSFSGSVEYMQVDVTDEAQVDRAIEEVHSRFGRIDMLIHGAGVQKSTLLQDRTTEDFRRTFRVKVEGLKNLVAATKKQIGYLPSVHVLTSAYSIFGNDGQHDYCAANETMDRLCDMTSTNPDTNWSSIAWLAWDGIGMTRGSEYKILARQRKLSGVDTATGQRIFRDVIAGKTGAAINVPMSDAEHLQYHVETAPPLDSVNPKAEMIEVPIDLAEIGCLPFHLVRGAPTLPGAWIVDCMVHAALKLCPDHDSISEAVLDQPSFKRFVRHTHGTNPNVRVFAQRQGDAVKTWLVLDVVHASGELLTKDVVCADATITLHRRPNGLAPQLDAVCNRDLTERVRDPYCGSVGGEVELSGPFDCLGPIEIGSCGRHASVDVSAGRIWHSDTPALLLDAAWRVAAVKATEDDALFVPVQIQQLIVPVLGENPGMLQSSSRWEIRSQPKRDGDNVRWQRTEVVDERGNVRIVVDGGFAVRMN